MADGPKMRLEAAEHGVQESAKESAQKALLDQYLDAQAKADLPTMKKLVKDWQTGVGKFKKFDNALEIRRQERAKEVTLVSAKQDRASLVLDLRSQAGEKPSTDYTALGRLAAFEESGMAYSDLASPEISRLSAAIRIAFPPAEADELVAALQGGDSSVAAKAKEKYEEIKKAHGSMKEINADVKRLQDSYGDNLLDGSKNTMKELAEAAREHPVVAAAGLLGAAYLAYSLWNSEGKAGTWIKYGLAGTGVFMGASMLYRYFDPTHKASIDKNILGEGWMYSPSTLALREQFKAASGNDAAFDEMLKLGEMKVSTLLELQDDLGRKPFGDKAIDTGIISAHADVDPSVVRGLNRENTAEGVEALCILVDRNLNGNPNEKDENLAIQRGKAKLVQILESNPGLEVRYLLAMCYTNMQPEHMNANGSMDQNSLQARVANPEDLKRQDALKSKLGSLAGSNVDVLILNGKTFIKGYPFTVTGDGTKESPYRFVSATGTFEIGADRDDKGTPIDLKNKVSEMLTFVDTEVKKAFEAAHPGNTYDLKYVPGKNLYEVAGVTGFDAFTHLLKAADKKPSEKVYVTMNADGTLEVRPAEHDERIYKTVEELTEGEIKKAVLAAIKEQLPYSIGGAGLDLKVTTPPTAASGAVAIAWENGLKEATLAFANGRITAISGLELNRTPKLQQHFMTYSEKAAREALEADPGIQAKFKKLARDYGIAAAADTSWSSWNPFRDTTGTSEVKKAADKAVFNMSTRLAEFLNTHPNTTPTEWEKQLTDELTAEGGKVNAFRTDNEAYDAVEAMHSSLEKRAFMEQEVRKLVAPLYGWQHYIVDTGYSTLVNQFAQGQIDAIESKMTGSSEADQDKAVKEGLENLAKNIREVQSILTGTTTLSDLKTYAAQHPNERASVVVSNAIAKGYDATKTQAILLKDFLSQTVVWKAATTIAGDVKDATEEVYGGAIVATKAVYGATKDATEEVFGDATVATKAVYGAGKYAATETGEAVKNAFVERPLDMNKKEDVKEYALRRFDKELELGQWLRCDGSWPAHFRERFENHLEDCELTSTTPAEFKSKIDRLVEFSKIERRFYNTIVERQVSMGDTGQQTPLFNILAYGTAALVTANPYLKVGSGLGTAFYSWYNNTTLPGNLSVDVGRAFADRIERVMDSAYTGLFADPAKTPLDYKRNLEAALKQMIDEAQARDGRLLHVGPISLDAVDPLNGYGTGI